jgi:CPA1 family monovalent cation:H+ antiporter
VTGSFGAKYGMSTRTRLAVEDFWEYAAFFANTMVFLLMGLVLNMRDLIADGGLVVASFLATVLARAIAIYCIWPLLRASGQHLPWAWSHVMVWGGLRGSLSMVLVLGISPSFSGRETLIHLVFGTVSASLFLQGLTVGPLLAWLGVSSGYDVRRIQAEADRARILGVVAAERRLHGMVSDGRLDAVNAERLRTWFVGRREGAETELRQLLGADATLADQRIAEAILRLLDVEREAIRHAARLEVVHPDAADEALAELDLRMSDLRSGLQHGSLSDAVERVLSGRKGQDDYSHSSDE